MHQNQLLNLASNYLNTFKPYELLIEFKNLQNPDHCPSGMYITPKIDDLFEQGPSVQFITEMFHPLIDRLGNFNLRTKFPIWNPHQDHISHVLHYLRDSFKESIFNSLIYQESNCYNSQCYLMYKEERKLFAKLAAQCAQLSSSESTLFDQSTFGSPVYGTTTSMDDVLLFSQISDKQEQEIRHEMTSFLL